MAVWPSARCGPACGGARVDLRRPRRWSTAAATRTTSSTRRVSANDVTGVLALPRASCSSASPRGSRSPPRRGRRGPARAGRPRAAGFAVVVVRRSARSAWAIVDIHSLHRPVGVAAERRLQDRPLHGLRRRRARGLVPPVAQRRVGADDLGRRRQPPLDAAPREDARAPRLRRARLRPARQRQQRGHRQLLRLGLGQGRRRGDGLPRAAHDVRAGRIGALGLSTGADMAIDAAGRRPDLRAVVADGSAAIGYEDIKEYTHDPLDRAADVAAVQGHRGDPGPLRPRGLARRPDRAHARAATCSSPPTRPRRTGASSTTAAAARAASSGTCRTPATPRR